MADKTLHHSCTRVFRCPLCRDCTVDCAIAVDRIRSFGKLPVGDRVER